MTRTLSNPGRSEEATASTLVRRYVVQSLGAVAVVTVALCFAVGLIAKEQEIALATDLAERVSRHIAQELLERWLPNHAISVAAGDAAAFDELERLFALHRESLGIRRIVWFDAQGRIVHCDVRDAIGERPQGDSELEEALLGKTAWEWRARGSPVHLDGRRFDVPLLEIYVPLTGSAEGPLAGHVIELYTDATGVESRVAETRLETLLSCALAAGTLFIAVWRLVRGAQRRLADQNEALRRLSTDLERQVEERTRALIRSRRLAEVGTLAAGLAHEINNPLAIIVSCAQGLLDRLRRKDGALDDERGDFDEYLRSIESETFRCKRITESLLDFARSRPQEPKEVALRLFVDEVVALMRTLAAKRGQTIEVRGGEDDPLTVRIDAGAMKQVVINLLNNAFDASAPGSRVEVELARRDDVATVTVRDWGHGFGEHGPERIFEPFFTTKAPGAGAGMGLTVSRHLAELNGGRLVAEIPPDGTGARFRLELPLARVGAPG